MSLIIRNGRLLDPASGTDRRVDIQITDGRVRRIAPAGSVSSSGAAELIDAGALWVLPGLVDIHVHLREPGAEYKEDIASGSRAAAAGGFTTVVAMPNTVPVVDNGEVARFVIARGEEAGHCRVLTTGAITVGQRGETLAPFAELRAAGAVAVTDDGHPVSSPRMMRSALEYAKSFGLPVLSHAEDPDLARGGQMHEGVVSTRLGLAGIPRVAEDVAVARDITLAQYTGGRLHVCHVSTRGAVDLVRAAKARGVRVTAEATPHHFTLTHEAVAGYRTVAKVNPPLREEEDRLAVIDGLKDGTVDAIATDHAPHSSIEKDVAFSDASNGVIGLQTALPLTLDLWRDGRLPLLTAVEKLTAGPARVLGLPYGAVSEDGWADLTLVDPDVEWLFAADAVLSKSKNSPFLGRKLRGRVEATILAGKVVHRQTADGV